MVDCCKHIKNPCMVCRRTVTTRTGLQCQGSCQAWIHFACCKYTPGKVKDIKAKIIKVRCPCPECTPPVMKEELLQDEPSFICPPKPDGSHRCKMAKCGREECPHDKVIQMPSNMPVKYPYQLDSNPAQRKTNTQDVGDQSSGASSSPISFMPVGDPASSRNSEKPVMPSISVVENMCNTVGLLSAQLNELMHITRCKGLQPYVLKQLKITLCLTIGNLITGYTMASSDTIVSKLRDPKLTILSHVLNDKDRSLITSALIIGAIIGANVFGYIANKIGRKPSLIIVSCFNIVGYTSLANAGSVATLLMGTVTVGIAVGSIVVLNVVYLAEIASSNIRGSLTTLTCISHLIGSLLMYSIAPYISLATGCYLGVCVSWVRWHCFTLSSLRSTKDKLVDAKLTLHNLGRTKHILVDEELKLITESANETLLSHTENNQMTPAQIWLKEVLKRNIKRFLITTLLFCLQVGGGITAVISFAMKIFKNEHSSVDPNVGANILGLTGLCRAVMTPLLIERWGRRILLLMSVGCCSLCMGILGTYFYLEVNHYTMIRSIRWLPLVLLMICLFTFNIGLAIVPDTLAGEMYSPPLRTTGSAISMTLAWSMALATGSYWDHILAILRNHGIFWLYSGINAVGFVFMLVVVPETKGKSFVEIGYLLNH